MQNDEIQVKSETRSLDRLFQVTTVDSRAETLWEREGEEKDDITKARNKGTFAPILPWNRVQLFL